MRMDVAESTDKGLRHTALFYRDLDDFALAVADFVRAGAAAGEPALVAVPGAKQELLQLALGQPPLADEHLSSTGRSDGVSGTAPAASVTATRTQVPVILADMSELGRNPARIMPTVQAFIDQAAGEPVRFVGEPIWPGRSAAEICEATRHEALINRAFRHSGATILCPYDVARLPDEVIADARRTHPVLITAGQPERSQDFTGVDGMPARCDEPLTGVPADATIAAYTHDLRVVRTRVRAAARHAGLSHSRTVDLVLAASEVAANTLRYTSAGGIVSLWRTDHELICQLADTGHIADPLAGRQPPDQDRPGGQGLWLVNQVCDLVELRTGENGTVVRLHMRLTNRDQAPPQPPPH
jgi:anti-sigma regulatory factor (Ser/Thr protein kinase)